MAIASLNLDSGASATLSATAVIPVLNGAVTGTGPSNAAEATLGDLAVWFGANVGGPVSGTSVTFTTNVTSATALATPSAYAATRGSLFASTVSGATLMGFGTTGDVTLKNRAGTDVLVVTSNTTGVTLAGALAMTGALSGVTTLGMSGALSGATTIASTTSILTSGTGGVGYATGAGGTIGQLTDKTTTVVLNKACGAITMQATTLNAGVIVSFTLTNSTIAATDILNLNHISGGTVGSYLLNAQCGTGSAVINVRNTTAGNLSEALVIQFALQKGVNS